MQYKMYKKNQTLGRIPSRWNTISCFTGPFRSGAAAQRASECGAQATARLARDRPPVMALPAVQELKTVSFSPEEIGDASLKILQHRRNFVGI